MLGIVTTEHWMIMPDGDQYRAVYGDVQQLADGGVTVVFANTDSVSITADEIVCIAGSGNPRLTSSIYGG